MIARLFEGCKKSVWGGLWDGGGSMCLEKKEMRHMIEILIQSKVFVFFPRAAVIFTNAPDVCF